MKISVRWLKELLPGLKAGPKQIADKLVQAGFEIESVEDREKGLQSVVVGQVLEVARHPQADRLSLCKVSDGNQTYQIVCGASNVAAGKKYPLALEGAVLPGGLTIKKTTIRGIESSGMLCSSAELGLPGESHGIYELEDSLPVGRPIAPVLGDTVIDVAVPPNRGDLLSHWGMAREIAALFKLRFSEKKISSVTGSFSIKDEIKISVEDVRGCPRYCSRVIRGVRVGPSPLWIVRRLSHLGFRSINNVVDATNYVMLETGHPLHAFDKRFLKGSRLIIRKAASSQTFETLDGSEHTLLPDDLIIADAEGAVALAGIMGGKNSEVREDTTVLVLEAASFDPARIRKTARRLGLHTDSSHRFERRVNPETVKSALNRLTGLILETAGEEPSRDSYDRYFQKPKPCRIRLSEENLSALVGTKVPLSVARTVLGRMGFKTTGSSKNLNVSIPSFRADLSREVDLIEEVVRHRGFAEIPSLLPPSRHRLVREGTTSRLEDPARRFFASHGFVETIHYSFCDPRELAKAKITGPYLSLSNPLSEELSVLRPTLFVSLLSAFRKNRKEGKLVSRFFELRSVYDSEGREKKSLAGIYGGALFEKQWSRMEKEADVFLGKGVLEDFFKGAGIEPVDWKGTSSQPSQKYPWLNPYQTVELFLADVPLGVLGKIHPEIEDSFELGRQAFFFDLDFSKMAELWNQKNHSYSSYSMLPRVIRDLALVMDRNLQFGEIEAAIKKFNPPWLTSVRLFDVYEGDQLPAGKKSLALSLVYEDFSKTLTDEEVNKVHFDLVDQLSRELGVVLR